MADFSRFDAFYRECQILGELDDDTVDTEYRDAVDDLRHADTWLAALLAGDRRFLMSHMRRYSQIRELRTVRKYHRKRFVKISNRRASADENPVAIPVDKPYR